MKKKLGTLLLSLLFVSCGTAGVSITPVHYSCTGFFDDDFNYHTPLNTYVDITMYDKDRLNSVSESFNDKIISLHKEMDAYNPYAEINNLFAVNYAEEPLKVTDEFISLLEKGIELTKLTKGKMNIAIGSVIDLWKDAFDDGQNEEDDPGEEEIKEALKSIPDEEEIQDYILINKEDSTVDLIHKEDSFYPTLLNFGAISKGFALDETVSLFGEDAAIVSAGSSSVHLNGKAPYKERDYYIMNLNEPEKVKTQSGSFCSVKLEGNTNISTSGDYEKCFYSRQTGELRSHILNPETGYSSNYHAQVCVFSKMDAVLLDGLSTALMNTETEEINALVETFETAYGYPVSYAVFDRAGDKEYTLTCNSLFRDQMDQSSSEIKKINVI